MPKTITVRCVRGTPTEERFWLRVYKNRSDECWPWIGSCFPRGYGSFIDKERTEMYAHRMAYRLTYGPIPKGLQVMHSCDNPWCCNPNHLSLGTALDNRNDCKAKDRHNRGTVNGSAKLTDQQVVELRLRYAQGGISYSKLGLLFGISTSTAHLIVHRRKWQHIP